MFGETTYSPTGAPLAPLPPPAPPSPDRRTRRFLAGVALGALVGSVSAAGVFAVTHTNDHATVTSAATPVGSVATSPSLASTGALDVQQIVKKVEPSVVTIHVESGPSTGSGSGFILTADGYIVTNNHVVGSAGTITVDLASGRSVPGKLVGADPTTDLAVVKVDLAGLAPVTIGDSTRLKVGDDVVALGNALNLAGTPTVTRGIISALDRDISPGGENLSHVLQTDAAINPGNSGGPLVDSQGRVIGINTAVAGDAQNIGFAIPISRALPIIQQLQAGKVPAHPFLGVETLSVTKDNATQLGVSIDHGAFVQNVLAGSAAEQAGIQRGDVITKIADKTITSSDDLGAAIEASSSGAKVSITAQRGGSTVTVEATLGTRSSSSS